MTKLTREMKDTRVYLADIFPDVELYSFPEYGVTVGIQRTGEIMGKFAVAIMADDESRFKRKVGELAVLERFERGETLPLRMDSVFADVLDAALNIAQAVA